MHLVEVGSQLQQPHRAARLGDRVEQHIAQHAQHGGPLDLQVGVHGRDEALEVVVEPQHVEVLDVGVGVTQLERRRVAHRTDCDALAALPRAQQSRDEVAVARDEDLVRVGARVRARARARVRARARARARARLRVEVRVRVRVGERVRHRDVEGLRQRSVVQHVHREGDVDAPG